MYKAFKTGVITGDADFEAAPSAVKNHYSKDMDIFTVARADNSVTYASDGIPDYIELATPYFLADKVLTVLNDSMNQQEKETAARSVIIADSNQALVKLNDRWSEERNSYPGLTQGTFFKDYPKNFTIGKGIDADTLSYLYPIGDPYYLENTATGEREYRMFQCCSFAAKVGKDYDNPRYPLETANFWMNIVPNNDFSVNYLRYAMAPIVDVSRNQLAKANGSYDYCSNDGMVYTTMGEEVKFTDGFRSIRNYPSHAEAIEYAVDSVYSTDSSNIDRAGLSHCQYTIVIRANRAAFSAGNLLPSTFLQTYINLAAVILWIIIGFYNQSYAGEDSLGMLSTGMFSAISATIVGFQMLSDASMFSLITMINIFTLAVILIMTYQAVSSKRALAQKDKALIAYNGVKLRIMFYLLTLCTIIMFIGLPIAAYIWTL